MGMRTAEVPEAPPGPSGALKAPRGSELRKVGHQPLAQPVNLDYFNDGQKADQLLLLLSHAACTPHPRGSSGRAPQGQKP